MNLTLGRRWRRYWHCLWAVLRLRPCCAVTEGDAIHVGPFCWFVRVRRVTCTCGQKW